MMRPMTVSDKTRANNRVQTPGPVQTEDDDVQTNATTPVRPTPVRRPPPKPSLSWEKKLWAAGHRYVAGVDEVGRGAWAGPLTVAVVVLGESPPRTPLGSP